MYTDFAFGKKDYIICNLFLLAPYLAALQKVYFDDNFEWSFSWMPLDSFLLFQILAHVFISQKLSHSYLLHTCQNYYQNYRFDSINQFIGDYTDLTYHKIVWEFFIEIHPVLSTYIFLGGSGVLWHARFVFLCV